MQFWFLQCLLYQFGILPSTNVGGWSSPLYSGNICVYYCMLGSVFSNDLSSNSSINALVNNNEPALRNHILALSKEDHKSPILANTSGHFFFNVYFHVLLIWSYNGITETFFLHVNIGTCDMQPFVNKVPTHTYFDGVTLTGPFLHVHVFRTAWYYINYFGMPSYNKPIQDSSMQRTQVVEQPPILYLSIGIPS